MKKIPKVCVCECVWLVALSDLTPTCAPPCQSVTPAMETILIDVARKVHDQRMDDIHARVRHNIVIVGGMQRR